MNVLTWNFGGFQQKHKEGSQNLKIDTFCRLPVTVNSAQCINGIGGKEEKPDTSILLNYDAADYSQCFGQIKRTFRALTKYDILQPYKSDDNFRLSNAGVV